MPENPAKANASPAYRFTIFIPTYNRAHTLPRAFESIDAQTFRDFEVVIVDDGSTDETRNLVSAWHARAEFPVIYHYQTNQGKHVAHNAMLERARGEFIVLLDSDDLLLPNALERLDHYWDSIEPSERAHFGGVEGLCAFLPDRRLAGRKFPQDVMDATHIDVRVRMRLTADKRGAMRTDVLRRFPYPVFPGERHVRPSVLWDHLAEAGYKFRFFNELVQLFEHQPGGLSANRFKLRMANPRGMRFCLREEIRLHAPYLSWRKLLRMNARYARYSLHAGIGLSQQWRDIPTKGLWLLGLPGAAIGWLGDRLRFGMQKRTPSPSRNARPTNDATPGDVTTVETAQRSGRLAIFLATSGHSGVDRIMNTLIPAFAARGLAVDLLHIKHHGPHLDHLPAGVRIVELGTAHTNTSLPALVRYLRRERPDALLSDKDRVNRIALIAARLAGAGTRAVVRTGTTVSRDLEKRRPLDRWLTTLSMRYLYRWAHGIVVPSQGAADDLTRVAGYDPDRVSVIHNPADTSTLAQKAHAPIDHPWFVNTTVPIIVGVGELCERKDFETLIDSFALVREQVDCRLVILGEGRRRRALDERIARLGLREHVDLPGFVGNPYPYMAAASVFAHSALFEGAGLVLIEALALGTPIVATDCPSGPREILDNGKYGRLVPLRDPRAMADAIIATLKNPPDRNALRKAAERYSLASSVNDYLTLLGLANADQTPTAPVASSPTTACDS